jgi:lipoprotein-anchoring transpeptidase ErfK/SrfK
MAMGRVQRQVIVGAAVIVACIMGIGALVYANQQGLFANRAQQLLSRAARDSQRGRYGEAQLKLEELLAAFPDSPWTDDALIELGRVHEAQEQFAKARETYRALLDKFPDSPLTAQANARLGDVNMAALLSPVVTEQDRVHVVKPGDTLGLIAEAHRTTIEYIKKANDLSSDVIRPGQKLKLPHGTFTIVVDKSQNQLLLAENNEYVKMYTVATGKDNSTPVGTFKVVTRLPNPVWYTEGAVVPPDSPENILGTRWLGINVEGYGIHGSVDPNALGKQVTAGCVRMSNRDVEELYDLIPVGTEVTIVD